MSKKHRFSLTDSGVSPTSRPVSTRRTVMKYQLWRFLSLACFLSFAIFFKSAYRLLPAVSDNSVKSRQQQSRHRYQLSPSSQSQTPPNQPPTASDSSTKLQSQSQLQQQSQPQQQQHLQIQQHDHYATHATPPPLSAIHDITADSPSLPQLREMSFLNPRVIKTYTRPSLTASTPAFDLFIITIGLHLRKLSVSHCIVGDEMYPVQSYLEEISFCILPKHPSSLKSSSTSNASEIITVALNPDSALTVALNQNVSLPAGHVAERLEVGHTLISWSPPHVAQASNQTDGTNATQFLTVVSDIKISQIRIDHFDPRNSAREKRYAICSVTMTATAPHILVPWVDYHRTLGVDHVYILDNGMSSDISPLFSNRPDVEIVQWPFQKSQTQATLFVLLSARRRCHTLWKFDSDEYLLMGLKNPPPSSTLSPFANGRRPLHDFIKAKRVSSGISNVQVLSLVMCNSGYLDIPDGPLPLLYTHMRKQQDLHSGKSFCDTSIDWRAARVHPCGISATGLVKHALTNPLLRYIRHNYTNLLEPEYINDSAWLIHFYARSWEEWVEKWTIGTAGIASGIGKDNRIGKYDRLNPDPEYTDVNNQQCRPFTRLRDSYEQIVVHRDERIRESVLTWTENGKTMREIVRL